MLIVCIVFGESIPDEIFDMGWQVSSQRTAQVLEIRQSNVRLLLLPKVGPCRTKELGTTYFAFEVIPAVIVCRLDAWILPFEEFDDASAMVFEVTDVSVVASALGLSETPFNRMF